MAKPVKGTLFKRGEVFWCKFKYQNHQYAFSLKTTKFGHAKHELERQMTLRRAAIIDGTFLKTYADVPASAQPVHNGTLPILSAWRRYRECRTRAQSGESTLKQYFFQFKDFMDWMAKRHPQLEHLSAVDRDIACQYLTHLETDKKLSANTFNKYLGTMNRTFQVLKDEANAAEVNPWEGFRYKKETPNRRSDFTVEEARLILASAKGSIQTLFHLGFYTGQRFVDCCFLKWESIDFQRDLIQVMPQKTRSTSKLMVELPMHPDLRRHLAQLKEVKAGAKHGYVLPDIVAKYEKDRSALAVKMREFLKSCGIKVHKEGTGQGGVRAVPQYGFHSCRHTFVTIFRQNKQVAEAVIQSIVGTSYKLYTHIDLESKRQAMAAFPSLVDHLEFREDSGPVLDFSDMTNEVFDRFCQSVAIESERRRMKDEDAAA